MADKLCIAGQLGANLLFEEEHKDFGIVRKVQFLYDGLLPESNQNDDKESLQEFLLKFKEIAKEFPQIKNPTSELALAYNNSRRTLADWFDRFRDNILAAQKQSGFLALSALSNENKIETQLLNISMGRYTYSKHEAETNAKMILELLFPMNKSSEPVLFMLPLEFSSLIKMLQEEEKNKKSLNNKNEEDIIEEVEDGTFECLMPVLKMPDIKNLTALQLKALCTELSEPFGKINAKLEEWILFCKKANSPLELFDHFRKNVYDYFVSMQDIINNNKTLTDIKNNSVFNAFENIYYVGICPVNLLWIYFELYRIVDVETLSYLKKRYANNKSYPKLLPIIHISPELVGGEEAVKTIQKEKGDDLGNKPIKKYLKID